MDVFHISKQQRDNKNYTTSDRRRGKQLQACKVESTTKRVCESNINILQYYQHTTTLSTHCNTRALFSCSITVSTENATPPKPSKSKNSNFSSSCGTNSNGDFGLISSCTEKFEFLDLVDFRGGVFSVESVKEVFESLYSVTHSRVMSRMSHVTHEWTWGGKNLDGSQMSFHC